MIIDKVDFQDKITNRIAHLDSHDQCMCRAVLTGMLLASVPIKSLDVIWRSFDEWVGHHYSKISEMRS
jgi:hypothetical protein